MAYSDIEKQKIFDSICELIINGKSLRKALIEFSDDKIIHATDFFRWIREDEAKNKQYARATEERAELMFEDMFDIADDGTNDYITITNKKGEDIEVLNSEHIQRSKLRVDTRKWALSKLMPKKYGDKLDLQNNGGTFEPSTTAIVFKNFENE